MNKTKAIQQENGHKTRQTPHKRGKLNGYIKRCSTSVVREINIKTSMRNHFGTIRLEKLESVTSSVNKNMKANPTLIH